jgi:hypothetical protein
MLQCFQAAKDIEITERKAQAEKYAKQLAQLKESLQ